MSWREAGYCGGNEGVYMYLSHTPCNSHRLLWNTGPLSFVPSVAKQMHSNPSEKLIKVQDKTLFPSLPGMSQCRTPSLACVSSVCEVLAQFSLSSSLGALLPAALGRFLQAIVTLPRPAVRLPAYLVHTMDMVFVISTKLFFLSLGATSGGSAVSPECYTLTFFPSKHGKKPC